MEIDTGTTELLCSVRDGVALITLNRPEARNAMSDKLTPALRTQIKERGESRAWAAADRAARWASTNGLPICVSARPR